MSRWYVSVEHLKDLELEFFGWYKVREDDQFIIYARPYGDDPQIVSRTGEKFFYVDDFNDSVLMKSQTVIIAPPDGDS